MNKGGNNISKYLKILVIGNSGAGKTSFVNKWTKNIFVDAYKATIVVEYSSKIYKYQDKVYHINLWDIAGQDHYAHITKAFSAGAHGCVTVADATDPSSLTESIKWKNALDEFQLFSDGGKLPNILVENKTDLIEEEIIKDDSKLKEFSKSNGFDACFKISAKTGLNIDNSMDKLISIIVSRLSTVYENGNNMDKNNILISPGNHLEKDKYQTKKTGCC